MTDTINILDQDGNPIMGSSMNAYKGTGDGFGNQLARWNTSSQSADAAILPTFDTGNARAADLVRNDGYAKSGVQLHIDHIVGHQFKLVFKPNYLLLGLDRDSMTDFIKSVEAKWSNYADDNRCLIDTERKRTFTMLVREAVGTHCKSGEITAKADWFPKRGSKYQTSINMIDYARISNPNYKLDSNKIRAGVKMDSHGAAIGYYVQKSHPNDGIIGIPNKLSWQYVKRELKWGRQQFIHLFEPKGAGQTRGANDLLAALSKLKMLEKFQETVLQNSIVNAMYAATIESSLDSDEVFKALGGGKSAMMETYLDTKADYYEASNINLDGTEIPHLLPNEKLNLQGVKAPSGGLGEFESGILRHIARSLNVSYEQLSGDFSKTNYSSARASIGESYRYFMGQREIVAKRFASMVFELWLEEAINIGEVVLPNGAPSFYEAKTAWSRCNWIGAGKTEIDGLKGVKESIEKIRAGLSTYEIELGNQGLDYQEIFEQQYREATELEVMGRTAIWLQSEPQETEETNENPEVHTNE